MTEFEDGRFFDGIPNDPDRTFEKQESHEIGVLSGVRYVDLLDPKPETITLADIVHGLAMTIRFNGNVAFPISVAAHSVAVSIVGANKAEQAGESASVVAAVAAKGLLHDAHEYLVGDHARPFIEAMEKRLPGFKSTLNGMKQDIDAIVDEKSGYNRMFTAETRQRANELVKMYDRESTDVERQRFQWAARDLRDTPFNAQFPRDRMVFMSRYRSLELDLF